MTQTTGNVGAAYNEGGVYVCCQLSRWPVVESHITLRTAQHLGAPLHTSIPVGGLANAMVAFQVRDDWGMTGQSIRGVGHLTCLPWPSG